MRSYRPVSLAQQAAAMAATFPQFEYQRNRQTGIWLGTLRPDPRFGEFQAEISYNSPFRPKVYIKSPTLEPDAPHRFPEGDLCLYYPNDRVWTLRDFIASTIVPWTAEWLYFYEVWKRLGIWYGPEAPHNPRSVHPKENYAG